MTQEVGRGVRQISVKQQMIWVNQPSAQRVHHDERRLREAVALLALAMRDHHRMSRLDHETIDRLIAS